jgi:hypothetical protein
MLNPLTARTSTQNRSGPLPPEVDESGLSTVEQNMLLQKRVRVALYQETPEIFEAQTTSQVLSLRAEVTKHIAECVLEAVNDDIDSIRLTDATNSARVSWYITETLLKIGLNMASQSVGGIVLDSLHEALNTHGTSPFELDKQMKENTFSDGSSGNVQTRRPASWSGNGITPEIFARQVLSDMGDQGVSDAHDKFSKSLLSRLSGWRDTSKNGRHFRHSTHESSLERLLMPLEILDWRMTVVDQIINAVIFDELGKVGFVLQLGRSVSSGINEEKLKQAIGNIKIRLQRLNIHGYITYLSNMAETLAENAKDVLGSSQLLSGGFWKLLTRKQLIAVRKESELPTNATQPRGSDILNLSTLNKKYNSQKVQKLWGQIKEARDHRRLSTSTKPKFGASSGFACFVCAELLLKDNAATQKTIIQDVHQDSSYRNYTRYMTLSSQEREFLKAKQRSKEIKLSIAIPSRFYA